MFKGVEGKIVAIVIALYLFTFGVIFYGFDSGFLFLYGGLWVLGLFVSIIAASMMAKENGSKAGKISFIISGIVVNGGLLYFAPSLQEKAEHIEQNPHLYRESEKFDDGKGPIGRDERKIRRMIEKNYK